MDRTHANEQAIHFYRVREAYGEFSNFARFPIVLDGTTWPTSEHYYQAQKFADPATREAIRRAATPMIAARLGRDHRSQLHQDWETARIDVMRRAVMAKFDQHAGLRELLLGTGHAELVEHTDHDAFWADGGDGSGRNILGQLLMEAREALRNV